MTAGNWWQVAGGLLELLGLATVMVGISDTRRRFTNQPSLADRLVKRPARDLYRRLFKSGQPVDMKGATDTAAIGIRDAARIRVTTNWEALSPEEAIIRMQEAINRHEDRLEDLAAEMDAERAERTAAVTEEQRARDDLKRTLDARIADAAAGGLTLETGGTLLFALGIVATVIGVWIG